MDRHVLTICTPLTYPCNITNCGTIHRLFLKVLLLCPPPGESDVVLHERKINICDFKSFIEENRTSIEDVLAHHGVRDNNQQLRVISEETWDLWLHSELPQTSFNSNNITSTRCQQCPNQRG